MALYEVSRQRDDRDFQKAHCVGNVFGDYVGWILV
jgi:hypothetical protein